MAITLYGVGPSRSFRCLWALAEAGLEHDFVALELSGTGSDGAKSGEYLKLNPQGKVPSLKHNDFVLTESAAILNYIDAISGKSFIPTEVKMRAKYDELAFFVLSELEQPLWTTGKHKFAIPQEYRVEQVLTTAKWEFEKALNAFSTLAKIDPFVLGDRFTFADILVAQTFNWADRFGFDVAPEFLDYRDKMYAREAAVAAIAKFS
ncbi:MAG: glutathione S-transferase [Arenicella sp.]|jgi:glutathione S-transferase